MNASALLWGWYRTRRSAYPWRTTPPDPYRVLVSEVMLQQTQAARVAPAFVRFVAAFPTIADLAGAGVGDVIRAWEGLGHNRRAVALWRAAGLVVREHGGRVPSDPSVLRTLPGVGPYTAAAVASFAYGVPVPAVDTNVGRVVARASLGREPAEADAAEVHQAALRWLDRDDPGGWTQALMDLGRLVCRPAPRCPACPLLPVCRRGAAGRSDERPVAPRRARFEGSRRQLRGRVVAELRRREPLSIAELAASTGAPRSRVAEAVRTLAADGLVVGAEGAGTLDEDAAALRLPPSVGTGGGGGPGDPPGPPPPR